MNNMWQARAFQCLGLFILSVLTPAWDPNAGVVTSYSKLASSRITASSNSDDATQANDGNDTTHWTSFGCLPYFYLDNPLTNVLHNACQQGRCNSSSDLSDGHYATDASFYNGYTVRGLEGRSQVFFTVSISLESLRYVTVRGTYTATTEVVLSSGNTEKVVGTLTSSDNYATRVLNVTFSIANKVTLRSSAEFTVHDIGAIGQGGCQERVVVDFGDVRHVRFIRTRHWAGGHGLTSQLVASVDGVTWETLQELDPEALRPYVTSLSSTVSARFVGVQQRHDEVDYAKVYLFEIDVYDENGIYGPAPAARPNPVMLRQMLGVNGIWGWGSGRISTPEEGAGLYAPVASYGRNYHNLNWDVYDPDDVPDYERMAQGHGTNVQSWLNWDTEYASWVSANVSVHVSIQFTSSDFPPSVWNRPFEAAQQYGQAFAAHFGPSAGNGLVKSVEVGNEPWDFPPDFYVTILDGMASGFKAADPDMTVMPGAFQAHAPDDTGSYIGTHVTEAVAAKFDVINSHHYCWRYAEDGTRLATFPENPTGSFNEVRSVIRWRDVNTPDKPLWMTEWGWDSPGGGQDCTKFPECTTERAAAAYAARGLFLHARLGVARSTWFFYANIDDCDDHVFCRSGLTSSVSAHFAKKGPYFALEHLLHLLGHSHFLSIVKEDDTAYIYVFGDLPGRQADGETNRGIPTHIVAWRPVDASLPDGDRAVQVTFSYLGHPVRAWRLKTTVDENNEINVPAVNGEEWTLAITAMPIVVQLSTGGTIVGKK